MRARVGCFQTLHTTQHNTPTGHVLPTRTKTMDTGQKKKRRREKPGQQPPVSEWSLVSGKRRKKKKKKGSKKRAPSNSEMGEQVAIQFDSKRNTQHTQLKNKIPVSLIYCSFHYTFEILSSVCCWLACEYIASFLTVRKRISTLRQCWMKIAKVFRTHYTTLKRVKEQATVVVITTLLLHYTALFH